MGGGVDGDVPSHLSISPKWRRGLWSIEAGRALIGLLVGLISMRTTLFIIIFVESYS